MINLWQNRLFTRTATVGCPFATVYLLLFLHAYDSIRIIGNCETPFSKCEL